MIAFVDYIEFLQQAVWGMGCNASLREQGLLRNEGGALHQREDGRTLLEEPSQGHSNGSCSDPRTLPQTLPRHESIMIRKQILVALSRQGEEQSTSRAVNRGLTADEYLSEVIAFSTYLWHYYSNEEIGKLWRAIEDTGFSPLEVVQSAISEAIQEQGGAV